MYHHDMMGNDAAKRITFNGLCVISLTAVNKTVNELSTTLTRSIDY
jgi:hypothetical protein